MPVRTYTVEGYREHLGSGVPLPEGTTIEIADSSEAIQQLTEAEIRALAGNRVTLLNATDNVLALNVAQFKALGTVGFGAEDKVTLRDNSSNTYDYLRNGGVQALSEKGVSVIDIDSVQAGFPISPKIARELLATDIVFSASKPIYIVDEIGGALNATFFSAPDIIALGNMGVEGIEFSTSSIVFPVKLGAAQAKALVATGIKISKPGMIVLADDGVDISRLSAAELADLASRDPFAIDAMDNVLTLSFDQYKALKADYSGWYPPEWPRAVMFDPLDEFTLELRAADLAGLGEAELVKMADRGVDVLSVKDAGSALSSLSVQQIEALKSKGADILDASDNALSLTYAQYKATSGMAFTASDTVTVSLTAAEVRALTDAQAAEMKARGVDNLILKDAGQALAALTAAEIAALSSKGVSILDATDNKLVMSLEQYNALGSTKLTASDAVSLSDTGAKLSSLSAAQVALLAAAGIDELDASDNSYALSLAQYGALGSVRLSSTDQVTIAADGDAVLSDGASDLTLTGSAIHGTGNSLANTISGNAKNNILAGLEGDDFLSGSLGNDQLSGGSGRDVFVFDSKPHKKSNLDKITDFNVADDTIWLDNAIFTKLGKTGSELSPAALNKKFFVVGTKAKDKNDYLVYDKKKGVLYYDADGSGSKKAVEIATLSKNLKLTSKDFFVI